MNNINKKMEDKVDLLLKNGFKFKFLQPSQSNTGDDILTISVAYNLKDELIIDLLDNHIKLMESKYFKLRKYINSQKSSNNE
jgi:hypothetical protein